MVRHAPTAASGTALPADEPISSPAAVAAALAGRLPPDGEVLCSPRLRCRQTAAAAGLEALIEPRLDECDFGSWAGRPFAALSDWQRQAWLGDPDAAPHGGESLRAFATRVDAWLDGLDPTATRPLVAFTHAGVIRAAVVHALDAHLGAFWRLSVAPLTVVELLHDGDGWAVAL